MMLVARMSRVVFSIGALAYLLGGAPSARAQSTTTYGSGGSSNTFTGGTIAPGDTVLLNDGASVTGAVTADGTLQFNQSAGNTLTISNLISGTGTLSLTNTGILNLAGTSGGEGVENTVVLDMTTSASLGVLEINSASGDLWVGGNGTGTLNVSGGYVSNANGKLGVNPGSIGTATVSNGTWANSGELGVGLNGTGTLNVSGGNVSSNSGLVGYAAGSVGTATVSGGTWANSTDLFVGFFGTGTLNVTGGYVSNANGYLGVYASSVGTATVSSGTWANSGSLNVTGTLIVNGGSVTNTDGVIAFNPGTIGTVTVSSGTWANSGSLAVGSYGTGTLTMSGGVVSVAGTLVRENGTINLNSGGTLQIGVGGSDGVLGVDALTNNGTLIFNRSDDSFYSGIISGTGAVTKQGAGTLTLFGNNTFTGDTRISSGTLAIGSTEALHSSTLDMNASDSGAITFASNSTLGGLKGSRDLANGGTTLTIGGNNASTTYSGVLSGSGGLTKSGDGTLTLSASNGYTGGTTISGGQLKLANANALVASDDMTITSGTLDLNGQSRTLGLLNGSSGGTITTGTTGLITLTSSAAANSTYAGSIINGAGTIAFTKSGLGTLTLSGSNDYTGVTNINGGVLSLGNESAFAGGGTISFDGGSLQYSASNTVDYSTRILNSGSAISIDTNGQNVTFASGLGSSNTGGLTKLGLGTLTLSGSNDYAGTTTISAGVLAISSTAALPGYGDAGRWSVAPGAGLTLGVNGLTNAEADALITSATATGNLTSGAAIGFDTTGTSTYTYANALPVSAGSGLGLAKSGTGTLQITGSSTYTGPTVVGSGTLSIGSGGTTGWIGTTSDVVLSPDGVLQFNRTDDYGGFSPVISGSGGVVISSGTLALSTGSFEALTIGQSTGDAGTFNVNGGSVTNTTSILGSAAGSVGTATVSSGMWATSSNLLVGGAGTGTLTMNGGLVTVGGTLSQGGASTINLNAGGTLQIGVGGTSGVLLDGTGSLVNNGTLVFNRSDASIYSGVLSGSGVVAKQAAGLLTLAGANSYSGLTTISAGTLALSGTGRIGTGGLDLGTTDSPGVFDLSGLTAGTYSLPATGNLAGVGTLSGSGKSLAVLGSFLPGNSPGTVTVGSGLSLDLSNSGSSVFEITDPAYTAGTYDLVNGDGSVVFGGILNLAFSGGSYGDGTDVLQLFANNGGLSGSFSAVNFSGLADGQSATFNPATGFVSVVPEPSTCASLLAGLACGGYSLSRRRRLR
jgi:autotransporter-associated beta strand protein/T5SS/PEP-CTERM-associated repeat protein